LVGVIYMMKKKGVSLGGMSRMKSARENLMKTTRSSDDDIETTSIGSKKKFGFGVKAMKSEKGALVAVSTDDIQQEEEEAEPSGDGSAEPEPEPSAEPEEEPESSNNEPLTVEDVADLKEEAKALKAELRSYEEVFVEENGVKPTRRGDWEPVWDQRERLKEVQALLAKEAAAASETASSSSVGGAGPAQSAEEHKAEIKALKTELRSYEDIFVQENGYKPTRRGDWEPVWDQRERLKELQAIDAADKPGEAASDSGGGSQVPEDMDPADMKAEIKSLKMELRSYEETFVEENGHKPTKRGDWEPVWEQRERLKQLQAAQAKLKEDEQDLGI